jgi:uncharacterized protein
MRFEYDPDKSAANRLKHGIDFEEAQALWDDESAIELDARSTSEPRSVLIGMIDGKAWCAVFTLRGEAVRLISVRRARKEESRLYDSYQGKGHFSN